MFKVPEQYRVKHGALASTQADGCNGCFLIPFESQQLVVIASDGMDWQHVSVSLRNRCPNWREMSYVKDVFWGDEDCVVQYHPPKADYVNNHPFCLHLWRPAGGKLPRPSTAMV